MHANRNKEPWVIVYSESLTACPHRELINLYRIRMQIELGFRDCKSDAYGLGMCSRRNVAIERRAILCLIASCTTLLLWCLGTALKGTKHVKGLRVNSSSAREPYSVLFLARLVLMRKRISVPKTMFRASIRTAKDRIECPAF